MGAKTKAGEGEGATSLRHAARQASLVEVKMRALSFPSICLFGTRSKFQGRLHTRSGENGYNDVADNNIVDFGADDNDDDYFDDSGEGDDADDIDANNDDDDDDDVSNDDNGYDDDDDDNDNVDSGDDTNDDDDEDD